MCDTPLFFLLLKKNIFCKESDNLEIWYFFCFKKESAEAAQQFGEDTSQLIARSNQKELSQICIPTSAAPKWSKLKVKGETTFAQWPTQNATEPKSHLTDSYLQPSAQRDERRGTFLTITKRWRWTRAGGRPTAAPLHLLQRVYTNSCFPLRSSTSISPVIMRNMVALDPWMWQIGNRPSLQLWTITNTGWNVSPPLLSGMCIIAPLSSQQIGGKKSIPSPV